MDHGLTNHWLETAAGRRLLAAEAQQVAQALDSIFGDHCLQVGRWGPAQLFTRHARTRRSAILAPEASPGVGLVGELDCLPIASDSIDAVLLPHVLETAADPHALLREVDRVLRPDGHLVVLGFNPLGLWGLRRLASRGRFPPGARHLITEHRLRDWLKLLSFAAEPAVFCHFSLPLLGRAGRPARSAPGSRPRRLRAFGYQAARRLRQCRPFAACYLLVARKEVWRLTPVRPVLRRRPKLVGGLVNPTTRNAA